MTSISIVVPCRNEAHHIDVFLQNFNNQDLEGFDWELIIADGASTDGTNEALQDCQQRDPRVRLIHNAGKMVSTGLNLAISQARGEIIVRMDVHSEYAPDYIRRCVETLLATGADNVGGPARTRSAGIMADAIAAGYRSRFSCGGARFHQETYEGYVDTVTYGCWRKETFLRYGLFDPTLVRNQDDEFNLRVTRAGGRIWQSPAIVSWYRPRASLSALWRQYFQYGFWKVPVIRKHRIPASWRHLIPGLFVAAILGLPIVGLATSVAGRDVIALLLGAIWGLVVGSYTLSVTTASLFAARKAGWRLLPLLPIVFVTYHTSYGTGFLTGLAYWTLKKTSRTPPQVFTEISR